MKKFLLFFLIFSHFLFPSTIHAVAINITNVPTEISSSEYNLNISVDGAKPATNYFRILIFKEGTHSYIGETWNGASWYSGGEGKNYFAVQIGTSSASAELKGRIGTESPPAGDYLLSVRRYTQSGSSATGDSVNIVPVKLIVNAKTPDPTPVITLRPTPTVTLTPTTQKPTVIEETKEVLGNDVEIETVDSTLYPTPTKETSTSPTSLATNNTNGNKGSVYFPLLGAIFVTAGVLLVTISLYLFWKEQRH